jgi:endonuclease YncB( thermonuclease family)
MARLASVLAVLAGAALLAAAAAAPSAPALSGTGPAARADRDCSDFPNQRAAQRYFISKGGPRHDPDHLDSDGDGIACETLPCPCSRAGSGGGGGGGKGQLIRGRIEHVVDGDTVRIRAHGARRRHYDVRLIGIDTPEKYGGRECGSGGASRSMRGLAPVGTRVRLLTDPTQDLFDRYGRLLAYVVRRADGLDLGRAQVARGWAKVYVFDRPFRRLHRYRRSARRARAADRGVWGLCGGHFHQGQ